MNFVDGWDDGENAPMARWLIVLIVLMFLAAIPGGIFMAGCSKDAQAAEIQPCPVIAPMVPDFEDCRMMHGECRLDCRKMFGSKKYLSPCVHKCKTKYWTCRKSVRVGK